MDVESPVLVEAEPPRSARVMYKVAALVDGMPTSIFDGSTVFPLGHTVYQRAEEEHAGGLYVFSSLEECLARDQSNFPPHSAMLGAPRVVLRVLAWQPEGEYLSITYGRGKKAFSFVRAIELLPMPLTWTLLHGRPAAPPPHSSYATMLGGAAALGSAPLGSPGQAQQAGAQSNLEAEMRGSIAAMIRTAISDDTPAAAQSRQQQVASPPVFRSPGPRPAGAGAARPLMGQRSPIVLPPRLIKSQARTMELEREVAQMESQLRLARSLPTSMAV